MKKVLFFVVLSVVSVTSYADSFTGAINRLAPNASPSFNGVLLKIEDGSQSVMTLNSGGNCSSVWAFVDVETNIGQAMYAALLTAYSLNRSVVITTNGCSTSQNFPKVEEVYLDRQ